MKKMILYLFSILLILCVGAILFINLHPAFGGKQTKEQKETYRHLDNYVDGKFVNAITTSMFTRSSDSASVFNNSSTNAKDRNPAAEIQVSTIDWNKIKSEKDSLTWLGHSAFLISIDNKKILLIDPQIGETVILDSDLHLTDSLWWDF
ncbi:MBL fold metallo-hydrolase [Clostridium magnum]|uniref:Uncharacterized protein n=1 Tax=Clostridium magnum DSM 2767 TaxID=1121326 RepID=A0A162RQB4_9CLOT|nr:MBL fold metallo-hydrolase [Clostridium magnum]KZL90234.1 hypothetical protein CLMAG_40050 [Clostridium magnum DSM 2767]SHI13986.1 hypothetical protein SAMN02745944_02687 [Clostridium magnum DSM 2767]